MNVIESVEDRNKELFAMNKEIFEMKKRKEMFNECHMLKNLLAKVRNELKDENGILDEDDREDLKEEKERYRSNLKKLQAELFQNDKSD